MVTTSQFRRFCLLKYMYARHSFQNNIFCIRQQRITVLQPTVPTSCILLNLVTPTFNVIWAPFTSMYALRARDSASMLRTLPAPYLTQRPQVGIYLVK